MRNFSVTLKLFLNAKCSYPYDVNWQLITRNGSLTPNCSLSNRSLPPSSTAPYSKSSQSKSHYNMTQMNIPWFFVRVCCWCGPCNAMTRLLETLGQIQNIFCKVQIIPKSTTARLSFEPRKNDLKEADRFGFSRSSLLFVTEGHTSVSRQSSIEEIGPKLTFGFLTFGPLLCNIDSILLFCGTGQGKATCLFSPKIMLGLIRTSHPVPDFSEISKSRLSGFWTLLSFPRLCCT